MNKATVFLIVAICLLSNGCSLPEKRTRDSDKTLRVMIDPDSIDPKNHVVLQNELVASGKFYVFDRAAAFRAVMKEQDRLHKTESDRFEDRQKYAHYGRLYGVGGVVVAHQQCAPNPSTENILMGIAHLLTLGIFHKKHICTQFLELVDTNTSEIVTSVRSEFKTDDPSHSISWRDAVEQMIATYPKTFQPTFKSPTLKQYEDESAERAQRQRETSSEP